MDSTIISEGLKWVLGTLGTIGLWFGARAVHKHDLLEERVTDMEKKHLMQETALLESELRANKQYVDKAEFLNSQNRLENKIDQVAENIADLTSKLLTKP